MFGNYFALRGVNAESYINYDVPAYLLNSLREQNIGTSAKFLDIGCGMGQMLQAMGKQGYYQCKGLDMSPEAVEHCRSKGLDVEKIDDLLSWLSSYAGPRFDAVVMSHVLEHLEKTEIITCLTLIRQKILLEMGVLFVMVPNAQSNTGCYWAYEDFTHSLLFTTGSLSFVLKSAGFRTIEFLDPDGTFGTRKRTRYLRKLLLGIYRTNSWLWNWATGSGYFPGSPNIFTWELKVMAK